MFLRFLVVAAIAVFSIAFASPMADKSQQILASEEIPTPQHVVESPTDEQFPYTNGPEDGYAYSLYPCHGNNSHIAVPGEFSE